MSGSSTDERKSTAIGVWSRIVSLFVYMQCACLTCTVKGEEEEEQTGDQVPQESDHSTGDAFRNWVHSLDEELKEYRHAAVNENAHQDAGSVQDGCERAK